MDAEYLKSAVGDVLSKGVAATCANKPEDPIEYLAQFLLKSVADEASSKALETEKATAAAVAEKEVAAAAEAAAEAAKTQAAVEEVHKKEETRLESLLESAKSSDDVYQSVIAFMRARTGCNAYVMLTDLPEKLMPAPPPPPAPPAEGEGEAAAEEPPPAEEAEPEEPPPKFSPSHLHYVAASTGDDFLVTEKKALARPPAIDPESDEPPPPPNGEGLTFTAIDDYIAGAIKVYHEPKAIENRSTRFFLMPRIGAYACAPFDDFEGNVKGCVGADTLGHGRAFTDVELGLLEGVAQKVSAALLRIETGIHMEFHEQQAALADKVPAEPFAAPGDDGYGEGVDPVEGATTAAAPTKEVVAGFGPELLTYVLTRRVCAPAVLCVLKGVFALLAPETAAELPSLEWSDLKNAIAAGSLPWGADMFSKMGAFDVMAGAGEGGWDVASTMVGEIVTPPEEGEPLLPSLSAVLVAKGMYDWLGATVQLHKVKADKEAAEAAAAAAAAAAEE